MSETKFENVRVEIQDGIGWAILNRPAKRNAMSPALHEEMDRLLEQLEFDDRVKVVVVTGADGNFSAGQDLKAFFRETEDDVSRRKRASRLANRWRWDRLSSYEKPTIAMVHGYCVGGAFMQLCGCDFAIAADDATFSLSEVNWGILPGALVAKVVVDVILPRHALYYACLGEPFDGKEAARIGLVNKSVPPQDLRTEVVDLAKRLMAKSPNALRATKKAMRTVGTMSVPESYEYLEAMGLAMQVGDKEDSYNSGLKQFLDEKSFKPAHEGFRLKGTAVADK